MIEMRDAMRAVKGADPEALVLVAETSIVAWADISDPEDRYLPGGAMSKASSMGLGLALAQPDRNVVVFDGDGCLLMNLGTMVTISRAAPKNLVHIVLENGVYALTGAQPIPSAGVSDIPAMARAAGYRRVHRFSDLEEFTSELPHILAEDGPALVSLDTVVEVIPLGWDQRPHPPKRLGQTAREVKEALASESD
jgi:thiamine pyrophosphate-dependent acetolactate synthase large subunit-like protein